ncbi:hypothetical protein ZWY2020_032620 [Hordeum vulgare]|nr:hypothetical protein ZWY2020_032620 [Hordeum vulgare]
MEPSGSGGKPVEDYLIQEPAHGRSNASSNGAPSAAVPPPPRATLLHLERPRREQAGGGADGSSSAAAGVDRKGKGTLPPKVIPSSPSSAGSSSSSTPSLDHASALTVGAFGGEESSTAAGGGESSSWAGGSKARVTWSDPVAAETREVPDAAAHPLNPKLVSKQKIRWEQQFKSLHAEGTMYREEQSHSRKARETWSDPVAAETREVPSAHLFHPKMVSRQRLVREQAAVDNENRRWEQQVMASATC